MKYFIALFSLGLLLNLYSLTLEPYTNTNFFNSEYGKLTHGQSQEFYTLREEMLTVKYFLQDIGIFFMLIAILLFLFLKIGKGKIKSVNSKLQIIILALLLPFITAAGDYFGLMQSFERGEFPHWADTLAIPLAGISIMFFLLLLWSLVHLVFIYKVRVFPTVITLKSFKILNLWLKIIIILSLFLTLQTIYYGQYWYSIPGIFWIYYYYSLGIVNYQQKQSTPQTNKSTQETKQ